MASQARLCITTLFLFLQVLLFVAVHFRLSELAVDWRRRQRLLLQAERWKTITCNLHCADEEKAKSSSA
jgi:hypothetical protein